MGNCYTERLSWVIAKGVVVLRGSCPRVVVSGKVVSGVGMIKPYIIC